LTREGKPEAKLTELLYTLTGKPLCDHLLEKSDNFNEIKKDDKSNYQTLQEFLNRFPATELREEYLPSNAPEETAALRKKLLAALERESLLKKSLAEALNLFRQGLSSEGIKFCKAAELSGAPLFAISAEAYNSLSKAYNEFEFTTMNMNSFVILTENTLRGLRLGLEYSDLKSLSEVENIVISIEGWLTSAVKGLYSDFCDVELKFAEQLRLFKSTNLGAYLDQLKNV